ncbi:MAG: winged helix-turn-helix domain-containing protein [Chloroflexota bacterium]
MIRHNQSVLVVTETHSVFYAIRRILTTNGWRTVHLQTIDDASKTVEENPISLVIIDDKLRQSTSFYHHLRHTLQLPVLVLSENTSAANGSTSIIDSSDYLYQPFEAAECINAIQAAQQRHSSILSNKPPLIHLGPVTIDLFRLEASRNDEVIRLTRTEWALLEQLISHANTTLTHQILLRRVWGDAYVDEHSYLHTYMRRLRRKLELDPANPCYLVTDVGIGYRLVVSQNGSTASHDSSAQAPHLEDITDKPQQLTAPPTSFLGRERNLNELEDLLEKPDTRLLTLMGPPGVGKTRMALHLLERVHNRFLDGTYVVSLAPLQDSSLVVSTIAQALEIKEVAQQPLEETLKQALQKREMLLLLDNFEHVLDAAPTLMELITAAPHLTILVTSRVSLRIAGEQEYLVAPLEMPDATTIITKEIAETNPAVQLFVQRSQSVRADFALTEENATAITAICARLDGLPLAIELAAARSKLFTPESLLARLDERLKILTRGLRGAPERHQTLCAALEWSYNLLSAEEQQVLMGLSVFVGGCTLEAATAVLDSDQVLVTPLALPEQTMPSEPKSIDLRPSISFLDKIAALVDHSLIQVQIDSNGESHFMLLETIREYALEKLQESGKLENVQQRYAEYYVYLAEFTSLELKGSQQKFWLQHLGHESDNLREAFRWLLQKKHMEQANRMAVALSYFWIIQNLPIEDLWWLEQVVSIYETSTNNPSSTCELTTARLFNRIGVRYASLNVHNKAQKYLSEALTLCQKWEEEYLMASILNNIGISYQNQGDIHNAHIFYTKSLLLGQELNSKWSIATASMNLGTVALLRQETNGAITFYEKSMKLFQEMGDTWSEASVMAILGKTLCHINEYDSAKFLCDRALVLFRKLKSKSDIAYVLNIQSRLLLDQKQLTLVKSLCRESLSLFLELKTRKKIFYYLEPLSEIAVIQNQPFDAVCLLSATATLCNIWECSPLTLDCRHYIDTLYETRTHLDEGTWQQAWEAGQKMSLEEAIDYALDHVLVDERVFGEEARQETDH